MDMDIGKMFHNFFLNRDVRACCRVNMTGLNLEAAKSNCNRWDRLWMGFKSSPHNAARHLSITTEYGIGDPLDKANSFYWDKLILNLPCTKTFDPGMPLSHKLDSRIDRIACNAVMFIDNSRITGHLVESYLQAGHQLAS